MFNLYLKGKKKNAVRPIEEKFMMAQHDTPVLFSSPLCKIQLFLVPCVYDDEANDDNDGGTRSKGVGHFWPRHRLQNWNEAFPHCLSFMLLDGVLTAARGVRPLCKRLAKVRLRPRGTLLSELHEHKVHDHWRWWCLRQQQQQQQPCGTHHADTVIIYALSGGNPDNTTNRHRCLHYHRRQHHYLHHFHRKNGY